jgi:hypothetical protein
MATPQPQESQKAPSLYNVVDWTFNEHQFKADIDFENPGIDEKYVFRATEDGFLRAK